MPIYRVRKRLDRAGLVIEPGQFIEIDWLGAKDIATLERVGAVARVQGPPLEELPGWLKRAQRLAEMDITTAEEFLEADALEVAAHMGVKASTVGKWQREVEQWLAPPRPGKRG